MPKRSNKRNKITNKKNGKFANNSRVFYDDYLLRPNTKKPKSFKRVSPQSSIIKSKKEKSDKRIQSSKHIHNNLFNVGNKRIANKQMKSCKSFGYSKGLIGKKIA